MNKTKLLISCLCVCGGLLFGCQSLAQADIHFSQFYESSLLRNPALTGVFSDNYKIAAFYRNQWSSITDPYETFLLDLQYRLTIKKSSDDHLSFGLLGYTDRAGELHQKITGVYPALNYNKSLSSNNSSYLSVGFIGGQIQYSFDPSRATFNNQFFNGAYSSSNPSFENIPNAKMSVFDVGAGVNFNISPERAGNATYVIGVSGYHFSRPNFSYYHNPTLSQNTRLNVNAAIIREIGESFNLHIHGNYSSQGSYMEAMGAVMLSWHTFTDNGTPNLEIYAGVIYRYNDAVVPLIKLKYKTLSLGVSYDVNYSTLSPASNMQGGIETTLTLTGNYPKNPGAFKSTVCPRF